MDNPKLYSASFKFEQESNCCSSAFGETLVIECDSSLGIENDKGCFYILKTGEEGWVVDKPKDMTKLLQRCKNMLDISPKNDNIGEKGE